MSWDRPWPTTEHYERLPNGWSFFVMRYPSVDLDYAYIPPHWRAWVQADGDVLAECRIDITPKRRLENVIAEFKTQLHI